ncbi:MAG TPA: penicillin-binding transpeptidase domain-containing protein [Gemmatimonadaceae bacterium]|nr:penicillin-binding transpeptidase domain-containing protein [Gemmatimonadaceae bacterium]
MALRLPSRTGVVHAALLLFALALVGRAAQVQLIEHDQWAARAERQHFVSASAPATRGAILDATGNVLVETRELRSLSIAPRELRNRTATARMLTQAAVPAMWVRRAVDTTRKWVQIPGAYPPEAVAGLLPMAGVHSTVVLDRVYSNYAGIRKVVGRTDPSGAALDGVELALDTLLRGDSATLRLARDRRGRTIANPSSDAARGASVALTLSRDLQEIAERALAQAVDSLEASGGDIVVMNPHTGEVLALASNRADPTALANTAITEPFEPGSTLKPFIAAALLERGLATPEEVIETYNGKMELEGRVIHDIHKAASLSLTDVIRFSSNIGIVRFADRLSPRAKYELLRDLGFGAPTGVALPAEASGTLREPRRWSRTSAAALAMGYEIAVTPLQLAAAYAAIANGGELLEPQIVREVRDGERVVYERRRRVLRRVFSPATAATIQRMLVAVVDSGTAVKSDLANFLVGGKSGTARRASGGQGYVPGSYTASFVGLFPGDKPQYVVVVKLDNPKRAIYGGETAAPVSRVVLQAALAARDAALDRNALMTARVPDAPTVTAPMAATPADSSFAPRVVVQRPSAPAAKAETPARRVVVRLPHAPVASKDPQSQPRVVPDVSGLTLRAAVGALHVAGFRVRLTPGAVLQSYPAAGTLVAQGSVVTLTHQQ